MTGPFLPLPLPATRTAATARLSAFLPRAGLAYAARRNEDLPGHPHVSGLSPYLRHRLLTEAEVIDATLRAHPQGADKFLAEVWWRTYWKGWLERRPGIWSAYRLGLTAALEPRANRIRAAATMAGRLSGDHRHRRVRPLGAGTGRHGLSAQPRADVVRLDLDLHPAPALGIGGGFLPAPPDRRRSRLQHPVLALGRRSAHARQDLCRDGGQHRQEHQRPLSPHRPCTQLPAFADAAPPCPARDAAGRCTVSRPVPRPFCCTKRIWQGTAFPICQRTRP